MTFSLQRYAGADRSLCKQQRKASRRLPKYSRRARTVPPTRSRCGDAELTRRAGSAAESKWSGEAARETESDSTVPAPAPVADPDTSTVQPAWIVVLPNL